MCPVFSFLVRFISRSIAKQFYTQNIFQTHIYTRKGEESLHKVPSCEINKRPRYSIVQSHCNGDQIERQKRKLLVNKMRLFYAKFRRRVCETMFVELKRILREFTMSINSIDMRHIISCCSSMKHVLLVFESLFGRSYWTRRDYSSFCGWFSVFRWTLLMWNSQSLRWYSITLLTFLSQNTKHNCRLTHTAVWGLRSWSVRLNINCSYRLSFELPQFSLKIYTSMRGKLFSRVGCVK